MPEIPFQEIEESRIKEAYAKRKERTPRGRYSHFNGGHLFIVQELERRMLSLLKQYRCPPLDKKQILEVGCGTGYWIRELIKWGARPENIAGVDLLSDRLAEARNLAPQSVNFICESAAKLRFPDATFDIILQSTVFTSILDSGMRHQIASEMLRVMKPEGIILWYDYFVNNPRNPDVRGVKKRAINQLFPGCRIELERHTLAPPITRALAPYSWIVCYLLGKVPILCTHYLGVIDKQK